MTCSAALHGESKSSTLCAKEFILFLITALKIAFSFLFKSSQSLGSIGCSESLLANQNSSSLSSFDEFLSNSSKTFNSEIKHWSWYSLKIGLEVCSKFWFN